MSKRSSRPASGGGDIIVFRSTGDESLRLMKRVVGLPGDQVEIRAGLVYVNGRVLVEPYEVYEDSGSMASVFLAQGEFFVLGDNRRASSDSRDVGAVTVENTIGRATD